MGRKFSILGGDRRSVELANLLRKDGNEVEILDSNKLDHLAIKRSEIIVGPLPFSIGQIHIEEIFDLLNDNQIFTAGKISRYIIDVAIEKSVNIIDYFDREEMQVLNAVPTAEGAIQIAMTEMPITLHSSNVIVMGYGRIGKVLSKMLAGIGANVYVEARSYEDLAWIKNNGYNPIHIKELKTFLPRMNVVFNTIPQMILDKEILMSINEDCIIIDLASKPGGVDLEAAKELNLKVISALGLPGKVAPVTAAQIIKDTIYNIIEELEV